MKATSTTITASLLLVTAFLTLRTGVADQPPKPDLSTQAAEHPLSKEDEQGIRKTVTGFEEAWNSHNMKALGKLFREDAEFINVVGMHWRGRDDIVSAHAAYHETMFKDCRLKTDAVEVRSLGGGHAIAVVTTTQDSFTTPAG
jgi:uncharacterized protein (TIGR02246 family)